MRTFIDIMIYDMIGSENMKILIGLWIVVIIVCGIYVFIKSKK